MVSAEETEKALHEERLFRCVRRAWMWVLEWKFLSKPEKQR
jgi:hypothetical protein